MLTDFQFADLGTRRDRASGAYFAACRLLLIIRPSLQGEALTQAEGLVASLREEYDFLRKELSQAVVERCAHAQAQEVSRRAEFEARYAAQQHTTGHLQAA